MRHPVIQLRIVKCLFLILACMTEARRLVKKQDESIFQHSEDITNTTSNSPEDASIRRQLAFFKRNLMQPASDLGIKDPSEHKVTSLPGLRGNLDFNHYAGLLPLDTNKNHNYFYWLTESPSDAQNKPLVIWLNGGPGCSSMDGLWLELGPFRLDERQNVKINPYSWHNVANMLFVDQPVGTGFSFTKLKNGYAKNDDMINHHFYLFLLTFFKIYTKYLQSSTTSSSNGVTYRMTRPIFITGESHAGHFIPTIAQYLLQKNDELLSGALSNESNNNNNNNNNNNIFFNIGGIALGNPWIDPLNQYNPAEFAHGLGLLSRGQTNKLREQELKCQRLLLSGNFNNNVCMSLLDHVVDSASPPGHNKLLMYDVRKFLVNPNIFPQGHENVESYLNRRDVKQAIHTLETPHMYQECTDPPYFALSHQDGKGVMNQIKYLLEEKNIEILIFNGQYDLICNHLNIEYALDHFNWTGMNDWLMAKPGIWSINKKPAGFIRKAKNLQTLLVLDAGHMVPMDIPEIALKMISTFIEKGNFKSGESRVGVSLRGGEVPSEQTQKER